MDLEKMHMASQEACSGKKDAEKMSHEIQKLAQVEETKSVWNRENRKGKSKRMDTAHLLLRPKLLVSDGKSKTKKLL